MALDKSTSLTTDHGTYWLFYFQYIREDLDTDPIVVGEIDRENTT